jgi:GWxTD domain-containing protein
MQQFALVAALVALLVPVPAAAQRGADEPAAYALGLERLAAGDTTGAIEALRQAVREAPRHGPSQLRLGAALARTASEEEREFRQRRDAERHLKRATELLPDDPEALLEYGILLRMQGMRRDGQRVLDRAWQAAARRGELLAPALLAELHFQLGRIYEVWWEDFERLASIPATAERVAREDMGAAETDHNAARTGRIWARMYDHLVWIDHLREEDRQRMLGHFRAALAADPARVDAAGRLLGHLADAGDWDEYLRVARRLRSTLPDHPLPGLFLALGLHEQGLSAEAAAAFDSGLALLAPAERRVFDDIAPILSPQARGRYAGLDEEGRADVARFAFTAKDPLFLTGVNERRVEHYARMVRADLKFGAPASGMRGWDTEQGQIWIRYGEPWRTFQCCYGGDTRQHHWSYGEEGPVFVFERRRTYRRARLSDTSKEIADALETVAPEMYRPKFVSEIHAMPHQVARFRGDSADVTIVEIYTSVPAQELGIAAGAAVAVGVFLFSRDYVPAWEDVRELTPVPGGPLPVYRYRIPMAPGTYRYAVEARAVDGDPDRPAATSRDTVRTAGYRTGRLALSDLLLAQTITPRVAEPRTRAELAVGAWPTTTVPVDFPLHLYFEVYGLEGDGEYATYDAELAVERVGRGGGLLESIVRGAAGLVRGTTDDPRVRWRRTAPLDGDRAVDYFSLELPGLRPGDYRLRLRVTAATGALVESTRVFTVRPAGE